MKINEYLPSYYFSLNLYLAVPASHPINPINLEHYKGIFQEKLKIWTQNIC